MYKTFCFRFFLSFHFCSWLSCVSSQCVRHVRCAWKFVKSSTTYQKKITDLLKEKFRNALNPAFFNSFAWFFAHWIGIVVTCSNLILLNYKWTHYYILSTEYTHQYTFTFLLRKWNSLNWPFRSRGEEGGREHSHIFSEVSLFCFCSNLGYIVYVKSYTNLFLIFFFLQRFTRSMFRSSIHFALWCERDVFIYSEKNNKHFRYASKWLDSKLHDSTRFRICNWMFFGVLKQILRVKNPRPWVYDEDVISIKLIHVMVQIVPS